MNPELEAILKASDAAAQAQGEDAIKLRHLYEARLADVLARRPNLSRHSLIAAGRKLRTNSRPSHRTHNSSKLR